jgi:hypothetical protein
MYLSDLPTAVQMTLRFYFSLDEGGLISQLIIIPSKTA